MPTPPRVFRARRGNTAIGVIMAVLCAGWWAWSLTAPESPHNPPSWIPGGLALVCAAMAVYYGRFRYELTAEGIRRLGVLPPYAVRWGEVEAAEAFEPELVLLRRQGGQRPMVVRANDVADGDALVREVIQALPEGIARQADPPGIVSRTAAAPFTVPLCLAAAALGAAAGLGLYALIGLAVGAGTGALLVLGWRRQRSTGVYDRSYDGVAWLIVYLAGQLSFTTRDIPWEKVAVELVVIACGLLAQALAALAVARRRTGGEPPPRATF